MIGSLISRGFFTDYDFLPSLEIIVIGIGFSPNTEATLLFYALQDGFPLLRASILVVILDIFSDESPY
nr:MAG TPA: hypothetical protein [Bacteriophage sp.]